MCGIAGFHGARLPPDRREAVLSDMIRPLFHRGPDSEGCFLDGGTGLGMRRLRIIDLSTGDPPIFNETRDSNASDARLTAPGGDASCSNDHLLFYFESFRPGGNLTRLSTNRYTLSTFVYGAPFAGLMSPPQESDTARHGPFRDGKPGYNICPPLFCLPTSCLGVLVAISHECPQIATHCPLFCTVPLHGVDEFSLRFIDFIWHAFC